MNLYPLILGTVFIGGIGVSIWGWRIMARSKIMKAWPTTTGIIEQASASSEGMDTPNSDLLPHIVFSYQVNEKNYQRVFEFPEGTHPLPEFNKAYLDKYPVGKKVDIYYNPEQPENATLEPETRGDWMILALGIMMIIGGAAALFLN